MRTAILFLIFIQARFFKMLMPWEDLQGFRVWLTYVEDDEYIFIKRDTSLVLLAYLIGAGSIAAYLYWIGVAHLLS